MRAYGRFSTVWQMAAALAVFAGVMLVLESGGLEDWAQRLELGPERTVAVPLVGGLERGLRWTGMERVRKVGLGELARVGWGDDPVAEAVTVAPKAVEIPVVTKVVKRTASARVVEGAATRESALPPMAAVEAGKTRTVALAGDSMMAVGLSSTILREAKGYKDLAVVKVFKSGTGLARPEVFNWQAEYPAMLKDAKPDVVLVAIGANDAQGFVEGGVTYPFGTEGWKRIYRGRVEAFLQMVGSGGATVVWLGLPPMKSGVFDGHIATVNEIDYEVVSSTPNAVWFSTSRLLGDADGHFQDYGSVDGKVARLRQPDGIHLTEDGAQLVVEKLLPWLAK